MDWSSPFFQLISQYFGILVCSILDIPLDTLLKEDAEVVEKIATDTKQRKKLSTKINVLYMPVLVGGQGAGKSTFLRLLAMEDRYFSDDIKKLDDDKIYASQI